MADSAGAESSRAESSRAESSRSGPGRSGPGRSGSGRSGPGRPEGARSVEELLAAARARLDRLTPKEAFGEQETGAILVDIRPAWQRAEQGEIPGSIVIERNHLEWRLDPDSEARLPWVSGYEHRIIVVCEAGYTSSLAAAALQDLGLSRATDLDGGYRAWAADGFPSAPASAGTAEIAPGAVSA